jgi:tetratricopeptide (TPR) repeat protein
LVALDSLDAARSIQAAAGPVTPSNRAFQFPRRRVRAEIELAENDFEAALATVREMKQIATFPLLGWWEIERRETLARAYRMAGRLDEAAKVHEDMLNICRGHTLSHYDLGQIYEEMGRPADAADQYTAFLTAWAKADEGLPQVEDAKIRLAALQQATQ